MIGFDLATTIRNQVSQILKRDLPELVNRQVRTELNTRMTAPSSSVDTILNNGVSLRNKAAIPITDSYGKIVIAPGPESLNNASLYKRMKNKINYGVNTDMMGGTPGHYRIL